MPAPPYNVTYADQADYKPIRYSRPKFTHSWVSGSEFKGEFTVDDLEPGVEYTIFCYGENLNRLPSLKYLSVNFRTVGSVIRPSADSHIHYTNQRQVSGL